MKVEEIMKLFMHLRLINLATLLFVVSSCGTYDYIASGFSSEEEAVEEISKAEDELRSDLQDYVDSGGDVSESVSEEVNQTNDEEENQLIISDEELPPVPTKEYDSTLIVEDDKKIVAETKDDVEPDFRESNTPKIDFERTLLNLSDKIQYRIATLSFRSGSSIVDRKALNKIKKIVEVAKNRNAKVKIVGHASTRTRDMPNSEHKLVNFVISDKRAQSVAKAFINYNFPKENLITEAVSDSKPLFKENMPAGTQANQRTEIFLIY